MMSKLKSISLSLLLLCACSAPAGKVLLDTCSDRTGWGFANGGEFPGATGKLAAGPQLQLHYDFTEGGRYVAASCPSRIPEAAESLFLKVRPSQKCRISLRLADAADRMFQLPSREIDGETVLEINASNSWGSIWGGSGKHTAPIRPWKRLQLLVERNDALPLQGVIQLEELAAAGKGLQKSSFTAEDFQAVVDGVELSGKWLDVASGALLELSGNGELEISLDFPMNGRSYCRRFRTDGRRTHRIHFPAVNPRNRYLIELRAARNGEEWKKTCKLAGNRAIPFRMKKTGEIQSERFGVCTHFSQGENLYGANPGWHPWKKLIDDIVESGMQLIRDDVRAEKGKDGVWRLREYDRRWIEYAVSRKLTVIACLDLHSRMKLDDFARLCLDVARTSKGLLHIFELGNEPNNFGDWIKTYGGTWNGKNPDNSTSRWVLENLKYANAGAEAIKKVRPDAIVIGTGAVPPTNMRYLEAGLTEAMDGIVEHPYSYATPPEKVPYGSRLLERDGIVVGGDDNSFAGLIEGYERHFKRLNTSRSLWLTEQGFTTYRFNGKNETKMYAGYSEEAQAVYLLRRNLQILGLPIIKGSTLYDYLDDRNSAAHDAESNFGLIRNDYSRKPAWQVMRRFNSLLAECVPASGVTVKTAAPLHRSMKAGVLIDNWDKMTISADNSVICLPLENPVDKSRIMAIWNAQPYSGEFNNRAVALEVTGWNDVPLPLVALDLITGRSFDVEATQKGNKLRIDLLELGKNPVILYF